MAYFKGKKIIFSPHIHIIESGVGIESKGVDFIDYDGTIIYSFTAADFAQLSEMPPNPSHNGLTAQGWNWTLSDAKNYVAANGRLIIGQNYITTDGKTKLYIKIPTEGRMTFTIYFSQSVANGVTVDWGDGTATETVSGTGVVNTSHTYSTTGKYTITLLPDDECALVLGSNTANPMIGGYAANANALEKVEIGKNVAEVTQSCFSTCRGLKSVSIPTSLMTFGNGSFSTNAELKGFVIPTGATTLSSSMLSGAAVNIRISIPLSVTTLGESVFATNSGLTDVVIPSGIENISNYAFLNCSTLSKVIIPQGVKTIGLYAFQSTFSLAAITLPSTITNINNSAFSNCVSLKEFHIKATTPPTLGSSVFSSVSNDFVIYVPTASVNAYKSASGWSSYSTKIQGE